MIKYSQAISFALVLLTLNYVRACHKTQCTPTPSHYDELDCTPILDEEGCCAIKYTCPERYAEVDGCQYRGKLYKVGEKITGQFLPKRCHEECTCENGEYEDTYKFNCRVIKSEDGDVYKSENILERRVDKVLDEETHLPIERCYGVAITDTKEIALHNKTKYIFDGEIYVRGGRIRPDGTCYECYCDEHLKIHEIDVTLSQCQRKQCGIGISDEEHDYLNRGCVPVYDKTATTCCPIDWRCPTSGDVVKKSGHAVADMMCNFGDFTLGLLDHVTYEDGDELNCKCYIPPMVHCLKGL